MSISTPGLSFRREFDIGEGEWRWRSRELPCRDGSSRLNSESSRGDPNWMVSLADDAPPGSGMPMKPCLEGEGVKPAGVDSALIPDKASGRGLLPGWLPPAESALDLSVALELLMMGAGRSPAPLTRSFSLSFSFSRSFLARALCLASA